MTSQPEVFPIRERTLGCMHMDDDGTTVTVQHVFAREGSFVCDDCGKPGHDPGFVRVVLDDGECEMHALLTAEMALLLANRLTRGASLILESAEDVPDIEREAAKFSAPGEVQPEPESDDPVRRAVWQVWNGLGDDHETPVKTIARQLGMSTADVAAIVYPADTFGEWADGQEPDPE